MRKTPVARPDADATDLIDMQEAIKRLGTTQPTFYRWLREGRIKGLKAGRQWRFRREDIERYLHGEAHIDQPPQAPALVRLLSEKLTAAGGTCPPANATDPLLQIVVLILQLAHNAHASDLHLQPSASGGDGALRLRIDGVLHAIADIPAGVYAPLIERIKTMANLNVQVKRLPQDGRILATMDGATLDLRVNLLPNYMGEAITARLLSSETVNLDLDRLPFRPAQREHIERALAQPNGVILVNGPTGCGKTTTLYALLKRLNRPENKLVSIEYPVEYILPGVQQVGLRPAEGLNAEAALRAVMRADPDVVMVNELRSAGEIETAMQVALTGHLLLTTMHVPDAAAALMRLIELGQPPFVVADAVRLVVGQRLLRRVCPQCATDHEAEPALLRRAQKLALAGGLDPTTFPKTWKKAVGCDACRGVGYRHRTQVSEVLPIEGPVRQALLQGADQQRLTAAAREMGIPSVEADALQRAIDGETTLEEVLRIAGQAP